MISRFPFNVGRLSRTDKTNANLVGSGEPTTHPSYSRILARERLLWVLIPVVSFIWFWVFRSNVWNGGDSEQWEREITGGFWTRKGKMIPFMLMQLTYRLTSALWDWPAGWAIALVSCAAGAAAVTVLWRMTRDLPGGGWALAALATAGFTTVFYGHVETYAPPVAAFLLHLLAVRRSIQDRWPLWTLPATYLLTILCHLALMFALPAAVVVFGFEARRRDVSHSEAWRSGAFALAGIAFWVGLRWFGLGRGDLVANMTVHPLGRMALHPTLLLDQMYWPLKFFFIWVNGGAFLPLVPLILFFARRERLAWYESVYLVCLLGFWAVWSPFAERRDFDLFSFPFVAAAAIVAPRAASIPGRALWLGLILGVNTHLWITRPLVFSEIGRRDLGELRVRDLEAYAARGQILIDERVPLREINRGLHAGGHVVTMLEPGRIRRRAAFITKNQTVDLALETMFQDSPRRD